MIMTNIIDLLSLGSEHLLLLSSDVSNDIYSANDTNHDFSDILDSDVRFGFAHSHSYKVFISDKNFFSFSICFRYSLFIVVITVLDLFSIFSIDSFKPW